MILRTSDLVGIPNFWNFVTNLPFLITGAIGLMAVKRSYVLPSIKLIYFLCLPAYPDRVGSAYYHYSPDNNSLVFDRIPMTIVFMALLTATITEFIDMKWGLVLLFRY